MTPSQKYKLKKSWSISDMEALFTFCQGDFRRFLRLLVLLDKIQ